MSLTLSIATTGLHAQTRRLDATASNTANMQTKGALPDKAGAIPAGAREVYQPVGVAQNAQMVGNTPAGTRASFTPILPAYHPEYQPDSDQANAQGLIASPNVDPAREQVNLIAASRSYKANASVIRTEDEMMKSLLNAKI